MVLGIKIKFYGFTLGFTYRLLSPHSSSTFTITIPSSVIA